MENFQPFEAHQDIMVFDAIQIICETYNLDPSSNFVFSYKNFSPSGRSFKWIRLGVEDGYIAKNKTIRTKKGVTRELRYKDLILHRNICRGETIIRERTCDSSYMLSHIEKIGEAIRTSYHWVKEEVPIYLIMDNAGGHGTNEAKEAYIQILKERFNIEVIWQIPNSPELNMLNLGVWMAVQSRVEEIHMSKVMRCDVLAKSVETAFNAMSPVGLENVHARWTKVLDIIVKCNGSNNTVETYRGKEVVNLTDFDDNEDMVIDNSSDEECGVSVYSIG